MIIIIISVAHRKLWNFAELRVPRSLERGSDETHFRERTVRQVLRVWPDSTELSLDQETHDLSQGLLLNEYFWLAPAQADLSCPLFAQGADIRQGSGYVGFVRTNSRLVATEANARGKNVTFPSLRPVPADPCRSPQGSLPTTHGRRRGYSNAL